MWEKLEGVVVNFFSHSLILWSTVLVREKPGPVACLELGMLNYPILSSGWQVTVLLSTYLRLRDVTEE